MNEHIPERDWKVWKTLSAEALNRFCQTILDELKELANGDGTPHERYLVVLERVKRRDREIADAFDELSRFRVYDQLATLVRRQIIQRDELARFSDETQAELARRLDER